MSMSYVFACPAARYLGLICNGLAVEPGWSSPAGTTFLLATLRLGNFLRVLQRVYFEVSCEARFLFLYISILFISRHNL